MTGGSPGEKKGLSVLASLSICGRLRLSNLELLQCPPPSRGGQSAVKGRRGHAAGVELGPL